MTKRILVFESFVVSMKGSAGASQELSVLMTVTKHHVGRVARWWRRLWQLPLLHISSGVHNFPTGGVGQHWSAVYLGHCDAALLCQLLFSLLAGVGVTEVRVEILV